MRVPDAPPFQGTPGKCSPWGQGHHTPPGEAQTQPGAWPDRHWEAGSSRTPTEGTGLNTGCTSPAAGLSPAWL